MPIGRALRKYGWDNFEHVIIATDLSEVDAKAMEIDLIGKWDTQNPDKGYNITAGGDGVTGWHPTAETKMKISKAQRGRYGERNSNYGHKWTEEQKAAASARRKNPSRETRERISNAAKKRVGELNSFFGKHHSNETRQKIAECRNRPVDMIDKEGNHLRSFPSIKSAAEETGINKAAISNCCRGKTKTSGGFIWKYKEV